MDISFRDKKLAAIANNDRRRIKEFGKLRAVIILTRLNQLKFALNLEELRYQPGNFHELIYDRKGQWSCDLDQPYRLVFTPVKRPIPSNEHGHYVWAAITEIDVIEIINYHKER